MKLSTFSEGHKLPPVSTLLQLFEYDSDTGLLSRKISVGKQKRGEIAGFTDGKGRSVVGVCGHKYATSYVVWAMHTGSWPDHPVRAKDGDQGNQRFDNLRLAVPTAVRRLQERAEAAVRATRLDPPPLPEFLRKPTIARPIITIDLDGAHQGRPEPTKVLREQTVIDDVSSNETASYNLRLALTRAQRAEAEVGRLIAESKASKPLTQVNLLCGGEFLDLGCYATSAECDAAKKGALAVLTVLRPDV